MEDDRHTHWSITINNPTEEDEVNITRAKEKGWVVEGQLEKGKDGTLHYQLYVKSRQRFNTIKSQFPRAHIEVARKPEALIKYVNKEETRVAGLPQNKPMTMKDVMILLANNVPYGQNLAVLDQDELDTVFWSAVRNILESRPGMISLLVQPNYIRAWRYTYNIWMEHAAVEGENYDEPENEILEECRIEEIVVWEQNFQNQLLDYIDLQNKNEDGQDGQDNCPYHNYETKDWESCTCEDKGL